MNENEVKELIDKEVERRVDEKLAGVTAELEEKAADFGFKAGMLGFFVCSVLTGIVLIVAEALIHGAISKYDAKASEEVSIAQESTVSTLDETVFALEEADEPATEREVCGERYRVTIEEDWRIYATEHDNYYTVFLMRNLYSDWPQDSISLIKKDSEPFTNLCLENETSYGSGRSKVHEEWIYSQDAETEGSKVNYVSIDNLEFPVSDGQVEILKKYLKLVPTST